MKHGKEGEIVKLSSPRRSSLLAMKLFWFCLHVLLICSLFSPLFLHLRQKNQHWCVHSFWIKTRMGRWNALRWTMALCYMNWGQFILHFMHEPHSNTYSTIQRGKKAADTWLRAKVATWQNKRLHCTLTFSSFWLPFCCCIPAFFSSFPPSISARLFTGNETESEEV